MQSADKQSETTEEKFKKVLKDVGLAITAVSWIATVILLLLGNAASVHDLKLATVGLVVGNFLMFVPRIIEAQHDNHSGF